ncbi:MAG: hypothetical protein MK105_15990 [Crocinitomicaceae bacterium]|nr:hypothetical protein [Crocinitomicaceae bacterium]
MKHILLLIFILPLVLSCKKDSTPPVYDFSDYDGNFYGELSSYNTYYNSNSNIVSDRIFGCSNDGSQLFFKEDIFLLTDPENTNFGFASQNPYSGRSFDLNFTNNFNNLSYTEHIIYGSEWGSHNTFSGLKMQLPLTGTDEHPLKAELEGDFVLNIYKREYLNNIDTNYYDTLNIMLSGFNVIIESKQFEFPPFHSYVHVNSMLESNDEHRIEDLYWSQDTIYINSKIISGIFGGTADTVQYNYSGVRL